MSKFWGNVFCLTLPTALQRKDSHASSPQAAVHATTSTSTTKQPGVGRKHKHDSVFFPLVPRAFVSYTGTVNGRGERHGTGTCIYLNGDCYEGDWQNDEKHGRGIFWYQNGRRYEGDYVHDKREGTGIYFFQNGDVYDGNWIAHGRDGYGVLTKRDGSVYKGAWEHNACTGEGTLTTSDGAVYRGSFVNGLRHGRGIDIGVVRPRPTRRGRNILP
ncbi:morn repeat protein [Nannochloropsis gaditana CCMP526]|uniref:morn repeat protein n=1 Tax=Nannochloropsis gaditana (strain CCMP526) TaxID=1093141 RepID=UPI00029F616A|nr:morn repeat protein [Nannochloropsis gaditana CCMP526]EKU21280.1 morn repeat protein [Nannochloropsis gaditana CCMP526]|eukprot:XP_005855079.1 morn repeat protein [Nannochloropsis gaditana CCMP526]